MADYPSAVTSFPTIVDYVDPVLALHQNERADEIVAVQTTLGTNPQGNAASLKARLAHSIDDDGYLNFDSATELTIASDAITITQVAHKLQPQSGTADDLATINGTADGDFGILYVSDFGTDTITIKHNTGNIICVGGTDIPMSNGPLMWYSNGTKVFINGGAGSSLANAEGMMKNGKIVRTFSGNDLVVSIKTLAGNNPSAGDPVKVVLNGSEYSITAALSVTVAAGTNTFKAGSAQHLAQILYLPVHLILRAASSAVLIGVSRCFGRLYSDFSTTATDEDYLAYSGSAPASTDVVVNIGYVSAQNSGTASYNWSVPSVDVAHSIPVAETPIMTFAPGWGGFSTPPSADFCRYVLTKNRTCRMQARSSAGAEVSNATTLTFELPFRARTITNGSWQVFINFVDNGVSGTVAGRCAWANGATQASAFTNGGSGAWTASGAKRIGGMQITEYEI